MNLDYQIIRSNRRTIAIQIKPDGRVLVRCPRYMHSSEVGKFVEAKSSWIHKNLSKLSDHAEKPFDEQELKLLSKELKPLILERVSYYSDLMGVTTNRITIRAQKTRWGSCSSKGNLNFNCLLSFAPLEVLDYVVVHELCHLKQMNHSKTFWEEVEKVLPEYQASRRWLKEQGSILINRIK